MPLISASDKNGWNKRMRTRNSEDAWHRRNAENRTTEIRDNLLLSFPRNVKSCSYDARGKKRKYCLTKCLRRRTRAFQGGCRCVWESLFRNTEGECSRQCFLKEICVLELILKLILERNSYNWPEQFLPLDSMQQRLCAAWNFFTTEESSTGTNLTSSLLIKINHIYPRKAKIKIIANRNKPWHCQRAYYIFIWRNKWKWLRQNRMKFTEKYPFHQHGRLCQYFLQPIRPPDVMWKRCTVIGLKISSHILNQSESIKIMLWIARVFPRLGPATIAFLCIVIG